MLLESGADPGIANKSGTTPLHVAAMRGDVNTSALLIAAGADLEARDSFGHRPIDSSRLHGQKAVHALLESAQAQAR